MSGDPRRPRLGVTHVITMLELGGAQRNTLYTVAHLDRERFAPGLVAGPGGILDDEARALPDVPFATCLHLRREPHPVRDLLALLDLRRRFREERPAIVHTHSSKAGVLGRLAASLAGVPAIVHTVHGWGFHPGQSPPVRAFYVALERLAARATSRLVAVSRANAEKGARARVAPAAAFRVIRSGVELDRFRRAAGSGAFRAELGIGPEVPLVGMVACLKPQKLPVDFVRVAARVAERFPRAVFVLAGDGVLRPEVEAEAARAGLGDRFRLLGWREDPERIVGDLDVLVLTSLHEGLPRVVPEAMAAGKPVVATAVDGTPEAVTDGVTGYLAEPGDVERLAEGVIRLLSDPELRERFGAAARERCDEWDIDRMVRDQEALYEELAVEIGLWPRTAPAAFRYRVG